MKRSTDDLTRNFVFVLSGLAILIVIALFLFFRNAKDSPDIYLLSSEGGASWIKADEPLNLGIWAPGKTALAFRKRFFIETPPAGPAVLTVKSMRSVAVLIDRRLALPLKDEFGRWREPKRVDLKPYLSPGQHELVLAVVNSDGPAVVLAYSAALRLRTGPDWETSLDYKSWKGAATVDDIRPPEFTLAFPTVKEAFASRLPYLSVVFTVVFFWTLGRSSRTWGARLDRLTPSASALRWVLMAALSVLGLNDLLKLPYDMGFDFQGHIDYIKYIVERRAIPFANEGLSMFQSPLYYLVSAAAYSVLEGFLPYVSVVKALKVITIACGVALVEVTYRTLKTVYPDRDDLCALGTVLGGLLPMNIYMSQHIGNEPMSGLFIAASIMTAYALFSSPANPFRRAALMGVFTGLALLSKVSIALLLPGLSVMVVYSIARSEGFKKAAKGLGVYASAAFFVSGWYYIRNWLVLGRPFVGGWENVWSQDPGYRTMGQFLRFGESLHRPFYSGVNSFWDSIYSSLWTDGFLSAVIFYDYIPRWNYDFLLSSAYLSLVPMLVIIAGVILAASFKAMEKGEQFSAFFVLSFLAGVVYLYLKVPIYSQAKASYMLGLTPCFAVLFVSGARFLLRRTVIRAAFYGWMACWAVSAYLSFFVVG